MNPQPARSSPPTTVPWREVLVFLGVTFAGVSLLGLLQWSTGGGVNDPSAMPFFMAAMFTPTLGVLAAAAVTGALRRPRTLAALTGMTPLRPRLLGYLGLGLLLPPLVAVLALQVGALAGTYRFHAPLPVAQLLDALGPSLLLFLPALVLMFGEEWGWRGFLLPRLLPLGLWPGLLASGVIWGLFHAPFTLRGYLFGDLPGVAGAVAFTLGCVLEGVMLGWLRLASGSVWPAVVAHGAGNLIASQLPAVLGQAADPVNAALHASSAGWPGWIVQAGVIAVLVVTGQLRRHAYRATPAPPVTTAPVP